MDVHIGEEHSDKFECGLCTFKPKDKDHLETHLLTCKIYKSTICDINFVKLADLKVHITTDHEYYSYRGIIHAKQNSCNGRGAGGELGCLVLGQKPLAFCSK